MARIWKVQPPAPESFLLENPQLPQSVANLLYHRDITTQEKIDEFLYPDYSQDVHDPFLFNDMQKAVDKILKSVADNQKIVVHGDYDADGVCASVILISTLKELGSKTVDVYLPHRESDGYGLNFNTVQQLADSGTKLIITCDCGSSNIEEVKLANKLGIDVIITDHHAVGNTLPPAYAFIHPKVESEQYPDKGLAGGGVAFKLVQGLLREHKKRGEKLLSSATHESWEKWLLDMVAIATVADMVPLIGESRTLTKHGLIVLNKTQRLGLQKLLLETRITEMDGTKKRELDTNTISFQIAPRINAAGRMNHANTAYQLLTTNKPIEAADLAYELNQNNLERQKTTEEFVKQAIAQIERDHKQDKLLFIQGKDWSPGLIGLMAGRIKDKYYLPTIIVTKNQGEWVGSGRSIEHFNLIQAMQEMSGIFTKFGGHPMACGFTIQDDEKLETFKARLTKKFIKTCKTQELLPTLAIDAEICLDDVNWELYEILEKFKPFGQSNEKPKYLARNLTVHSVESIGKDRKHLRLLVKSKSGRLRKIVGWYLCNCEDNGKTNWCKTLKAKDSIEIVFTVDINEWNGNRELQLTIVDLKKYE